MDVAIRTPLYMKAGADGVYFRGGRDHQGARANSASGPLVLYPATVIFQVTRAIQKAREGLKAGRAMRADDAREPRSLRTQLL
jgi:hypothetical protein